MKFSNEYPYSCITLKKFSRLPVVFAKDSYLINDGRNSVVKVQDQKLLHSWTLTHPQYFTTAIVYCPEDDSLFCVCDNNVLLKWFLDDENLKKATKFELEETVFDVLPIRKHKPVILFTSGRVILTEYLYVSLKPVGEKNVADDEEMIWADALIISSETKIVFLTSSKDHKVYKLHCMTINMRDVTDYSSRLIENGDFSLKNWCLDKNNSSFITLWSDGSVFKHPLHSHIQSMLLTVPNINSTHKLAICSVDADHIAILVVDPNKKETILEMWDIRFNSLKARKNIKKLASEYHQIECINSSLFIICNESLVEIHYIIEKSTLALSVGKSSNVSFPIEYCWERSTNANVLEKSSTQDIENKCNDEKMDVDEEINQTELLAERFLKDGTFRSNNRESDLFELLRFAIRIKCKKEKTSIEPDNLFNAVLTSAFREPALVQFIAKLTLNEVLVTLETLLDFVEQKISLTCDIPSDQQLFDWISVLIKANTSSLLLSKDKKKNKLLKKLDRCLSQKIEMYEGINQVQNMFFLLKKKNILPAKHVSGKYFVEPINL